MSYEEIYKKLAEDINGEPCFYGWEELLAKSPHWAKLLRRAWDKHNRN